MKGRNLGWGLEIWGLIKCKSKVGLGHFDKSAGPFLHNSYFKMCAVVSRSGYNIG